MCKIEKTCPYFEEINKLPNETEENDICNGRENSFYCVDNKNCLFRRMKRAELQLKSISDIIKGGTNV